jgi:hypothetical protein
LFVEVKHYDQITEKQRVTFPLIERLCPIVVARLVPTTPARRRRGGKTSVEGPMTPELKAALTQLRFRETEYGGMKVLVHGVEFTAIVNPITQRLLLWAMWVGPRRAVNWESELPLEASVREIAVAMREGFRAARPDLAEAIEFAIFSGPTQ